MLFPKLLLCHIKIAKKNLSQSQKKFLHGLIGGIVCRNHQFSEHSRFIESEITYVILQNDTIIGTFRFEQHDSKSELDDFCILPQHQNKGYGMCVLKMIEELHNTDYIEFATPYFCIANRYLYKKAGYIEIGTRSDNTVICFSKKVNRNI